MNNKILVIGQAPPAKAQQVPYDSTQFYDWLKEAGMTTGEALRSMVFVSVAAEFTGRNNTNSGHKVPSKKVMDANWAVVEAAFMDADRVIVLGAVAKKQLNDKMAMWLPGKRIVFLLHPSRRNIYQYRLNKEKIIADLKSILND